MNEEWEQGDYYWVRLPVGMHPTQNDPWDIGKIDFESLIIGDVFFDLDDPDIRWGPRIGKTPEQNMELVLEGIGEAARAARAARATAPPRTMATLVRRVRALVEDPQPVSDREIIEVIDQAIQGDLWRLDR